MVGQMDDAFTKWLNDVCNKAKVTAENVFNVLSDGSKRMNRLKNVKYAKQLEEGLLETSQYSFLIQECILFWGEYMVTYGQNVNGADSSKVDTEVPYDQQSSISQTDVTSEGSGPEARYIDVDANGKQVRALSFKQVLLRSSAIENLVRTIIKSGSGLGISEEAATTTGRTVGSINSLQRISKLSIGEHNEQSSDRMEHRRPEGAMNEQGLEGAHGVSMDGSDKEGAMNDQEGAQGVTMDGGESSQDDHLVDNDADLLKDYDHFLYKPQEGTPKSTYRKVNVPLRRKYSDSSSVDSVIRNSSIRLVDPCDSKSSDSNSSRYSLPQVDSLGLKYYIDEYAEGLYSEHLVDPPMVTNNPDLSIDEVYQMERQTTGLDGNFIANCESIYVQGLRKIFKGCLIGPTEFHDELIAAILSLKPVDDTHPELLIQLVSTLKIHWMDDFLLQERERIRMEIKMIENGGETLESIRQTLLLYKLALKNAQEYDTHSLESQSEAFEKLALLRKMLKLSEQTCISNIGTRADSMGVYSIDGDVVWPKLSIQPDDQSVESHSVECKPNDYETTLMDERMLNRLIVESRDKMLFLEEDIKMLNERKEHLLSEISQIDEEIAMKMEMLNIKLKEVETAQIELSTFNSTKINVSITDGASTHNPEDRSLSIGHTLSTERSKISFCNMDVHDQMYRGFYRDVKVIEKYANVSKDCIGALYSSIHVDFDAKHSWLLDKATKVVMKEAELEKQRLYAEVENARSIMGQIQDIKGKISRHSKSSVKHTTEDATADAKMRSKIYADLKNVLINDLKESFIKMEQVWSDFLDFYSDNKEFFGTNSTIYTEMKETYDQVKKGFSSFL